MGSRAMGPQALQRSAERDDSEAQPETSLSTERQARTDPLLAAAAVVYTYAISIPVYGFMLHISRHVHVAQPAQQKVGGGHGGGMVVLGSRQMWHVGCGVL